jgi:cytochrome c5
MQAWHGKIRVGLLMGLILILSGPFLESVSSTSQPSPQPPAPPIQESTPRGLQLLEAACANCHDLQRVFWEQKTEEGWEQAIARMLWRGAQLLPGEAEIIQNYLVSDYDWDLSPSSSATPAGAGSVKSSLPEGSGQSLVAETCVGCHDLSRIVSQPRRGEDWRRIVQEMVRLGTPLSEGEAETVIDYLSTSFRP